MYKRQDADAADVVTFRKSSLNSVFNVLLAHTPYVGLLIFLSCGFGLQIEINRKIPHECARAVSYTTRVGYICAGQVGGKGGAAQLGAELFLRHPLSGG